MSEGILPHLGSRPVFPADWFAPREVEGVSDVFTGLEGGGRVGRATSGFGNASQVALASGIYSASWPAEGETASRAKALFQHGRLSACRIIHTHGRQYQAWQSRARVCLEYSSFRLVATFEALFVGVGDACVYRAFGFQQSLSKPPQALPPEIPAETIQGTLDYIENDVAHITLTTNEGDVFVGYYPSVEFERQHILIGDHFRIEVFDIPDGVRFRIRSASTLPTEPAAIRVLMDEIEASIDADAWRETAPDN